MLVSDTGDEGSTSEGDDQHLSTSDCSKDYNKVFCGSSIDVRLF